MANPTSDATDLRCDADAISFTFSQCEKICLDIGSELGDALPRLCDLAALFQTLSQSLQGDEFRAAALDLQAVAGEIEIVSRDLTIESQSLMSLVALNKTIAVLIEELSCGMKTISALVFNVKIEAASFNMPADRMDDFTDNLQFLVVRAQSTIDEYKVIHDRLYQLLENTNRSQTTFQTNHQSDFSSIAIEISQSMASVAERQKESAVTLANIGSQFQGISSEIGTAVFALQVGDSTRQRVEHVHSGLHIAADVLELKHPFVSKMQGNGESGGDEERALAAWICQLQSRQLRASLDTFSAEMKTIESSLGSLAENSDKVALCGRNLFGSDHSNANSFLDDLEKKLKETHYIINECRRARFSVDHATHAVKTTMFDMDQQTAALSEIVIDMTILGMNAVLKSGRLGQHGKGLNVIAQELRAYAVDVVQSIKKLKPAIQESMLIVEKFSETAQALNADRMTTLGERMTNAIGSVKSSGKKMTEALMLLDKEAVTIRTVLEGATVKLIHQNEIRTALSNVASSIDQHGAGIGDFDNLEGEYINQIDQQLRGAYTMVSERDIHTEFVMHSGCGVATEPENDFESEFDAELWVA